MFPGHPLRIAILGLLACWLTAAGLLAQDRKKAKDGRSAVAVQIASQRLKAPSADLRAVSEAKVDDVFRIKVLDAERNRIEVVNLDVSDREIAREKVEALLAARQNAGFQGKLENDLAAQVRGSAATGSTEVLVWVKTTESPRLERNETAEAAGPSPAAVLALQAHHVHATNGLRELAESRGWKVEYQAREAPVIVMEVPNSQLDALQARQDVDAIYLARVYQPESNVSVPAIDAPAVWSRGITGSGVSVAVVEGSAIFFGHEDLADGTYCNSLADSPIGAHASGVAGIIASTHSTLRGTAPGVSLLSGNVKSMKDADVIACTEWAINQGARVINYSFGTDFTGTLTGLDRYVDYVIRHRAVTMVKSAGNKKLTCRAPDFFVTSPGKGWNIITVGNYNDRGTLNNDDDVMNTATLGGSCFEDPASPHQDREKPEIAAPGTEITTTYCTSPASCTGTETGTSFAAPHIAGCAALLMQENALLRRWPESIRAILMASAIFNLEGDSRLSEHDGAGGVECDSADEIVRGIAGGEWHGTIAAARPFSYTFQATAGTTVRVVIAWDSMPDVQVGSTSPMTDFLKADFDLEVRAQGVKWSVGSYSWDNSYEIVEFTAPVTGRYIARILTPRMESSHEYVGFAWWSGVRER